MLANTHTTVLKCESEKTREISVKERGRVWKNCLGWCVPACLILSQQLPPAQLDVSPALPSTETERGNTRLAVTAVSHKTPTHTVLLFVSFIALNILTLVSREENQRVEDIILYMHLSCCPQLFTLPWQIRWTFPALVCCAAHRVRLHLGP